MSLAKGKRSRYALKIRRKGGSGRIDPRWMWWFERGKDIGVLEQPTEQPTTSASLEA